MSPPRSVTPRDRAHGGWVRDRCGRGHPVTGLHRPRIFSPGMRPRPSPTSTRWARRCSVPSPATRPMSDPATTQPVAQFVANRQRTGSTPARARHPARRQLGDRTCDVARSLRTSHQRSGIRRGTAHGRRAFGAARRQDVERLPITQPDTHGDPPRLSGVTGRGHPDSVTPPTPPTPSTRLRPPTPRRSLVERVRLIETMRRGDSGRLIVIHAPAGFGKSTLAAQWCTVLAADGVPAAWLTVDEDDNHVVWFVAHLIDAFRQVRPSLAEELRQRLEEHGDAAERFVLSSLIDELERGDERVALVIDDWHRVTAPPSISALEFLIENSGEHLQVIVASRTQGGSAPEPDACS